MESISQKEFLERTPPGARVVVSDLEKVDRLGVVRVNTPEIELHCGQCGGERFFVCSEGGAQLEEAGVDDFLHYRCRNCRKMAKTYALHCARNLETKHWEAYKYGEEPSFGPPTPSRALALIGSERDFFLKGRRCENQGLGVASFVYYRRVVENIKNRLLDEILRVSQHLGAEPTLVSEIEAAKAETQFTKAIDSIKHALPQSLLVNGHNPLTLLHRALSSGVHELTDDECLEYATSIRVVLVELAERLSQAMKDEAELNAAISRLATKRQG